jgi:DNA adenine methylase
MKYMGSKARIAKYLLPIILKDRKEGQWYVEPFVGGANLIDKVDGNRIGADSNTYLISLYKALQGGWKPPKRVSEKEYNIVRNNKSQYPPELVAFVGFACSYAAKWFGGYRRDRANKRDYVGEAFRNIMKQMPKLKNIIFLNCNYLNLIIPESSIIYCDPPYEGTTKYKGGFDHHCFWIWCRIMSNLGHRVFVSEYTAPNDFKCLWEKEIVSSLTKNTGSKKGIEKLFIYNA